VIEEMTLQEFLRFHNQFKPFLPSLTTNDIIKEISLENAATKQIRYYSSGMKQRVKLAQAIFSETGMVLLDEPCSNLDAKGIELYHSLIQNYCKDRLVIVCSNDKVEYSFCNEVISILDYKDATF
jgi:ABC-type multidrug transport system ATPase subunit